MADINGKIQISGQLSGSLSSSAATINGRANTQQNLQGAGVSTKIGSGATIQTTGNVNPEDIQSAGNLNGDYINDQATGYGYIYIRYSHDYPVQDSDMLLEPDEYTKYLGVLGINSPVPPSSFDKYNWIKIRGEDGEKGDTGEKGDKGESGDATITINTGFYAYGLLKAVDWEIDNTRDAAFYSQKVDITTSLSSVVEEELTQQSENIGAGTINNAIVSILDNLKPIVDLVVSEEIELGFQQIENWKYISRAYLTREDYINNEYCYYMVFVCYGDKPEIDLEFQVKVV